MREAMDETLVSQIVQQIGNEAQQSDFDKIDSSASPRYFDNQLRELPVVSRADSIYQSRMTVVAPAGAPYLKRLVIQVARNPGASATLQEKALPGGISIWSDANALPVITRSLLLARSSSIPN